MEYKILKSGDKNYPAKLKERLGRECPSLYYNGNLKLLNHLTMAVLSADSIGGVGLIETNQINFTIRDYVFNYIGPWHSVMESEMMRLGLMPKFHYNTLTLFSAKGLGKESYESYLYDRHMHHHFPGRDEYFEYAEDGKLLMLSVTEPDVGRQDRKNIMYRNWISCNLADIVFIPYAMKGSKTYTMAKRLVSAEIPIFTLEHSECVHLHELGIDGYTRKSVETLLNEIGAKKKEETKTEPTQATLVQEPEVKTTLRKGSVQTTLFEPKGADS